MNGTDLDGPPPPEDLTARVFRALYDQFDLHITDGTHIAVPKGTPCFTASTIGEIARQISGSGQDAPASPDVTHPNDLPRRL